MLNRILSLLVAIVAPVSAAVMLAAGAHPVGTVTLAQRLTCVGLTLLALALATVHLRVEPTGSSRAEAAMWSGLTIFLVVANFASPQLGLWSVVAALSLAASSVARLVAGRARPAALAQGPFRRRIFA